MLKRSIILLIPILLLSSCSKRIEIQTYADVDSIPKGFTPGASFFIFSKPDDNKLLAKEVVEKTGKALKNKGYTIADKHSAQYYLFISYNLESEKRTIRVPETVGQTSVLTSGNAYGSANDSSYGNYNGNMYGDLNGAWSGNSFTQSSANCSASYTDHAVATQTAFVPQEITFFNKSILLQAYDAKQYRESEKESIIWQAICSNFDEDPDLRNSIDYLLISSLEYLGKNTQKSIQIKINNGDSKVKQIRKTYAQASEPEKRNKEQNEISSTLKQFSQTAKNSLTDLGKTIKTKFNNLFSKEGH